MSYTTKRWHDLIGVESVFLSHSSADEAMPPFASSHHSNARIRIGATIPLTYALFHVSRLWWGSEPDPAAGGPANTGFKEEEGGEKKNWAQY